MPSQKRTKPHSLNVWFWICLSGNKRKPSAAAAAWLVSQSLQGAISFSAWSSPASLLQAFRQRILIMSHSAVTEATLLLWWAACWEGLHAPSLSFYSFFSFFICSFVFLFLPPNAWCISVRVLSATTRTEAICSCLITFWCEVVIKLKIRQSIMQKSKIRYSLLSHPNKLT